MSVGHGLPKKTTFSYNLFFNCPGSDLNEVGDGLIGLLVFKELPAELGVLKCNEGVAEDRDAGRWRSFLQISAPFLRYGRSNGGIASR